jgi:hypothetical protein
VTRNCLEKELEKVILKSGEWKKGFVGIPVDYLEEIRHHCSTAFTKASSFIGAEKNECKAQWKRLGMGKHHDYVF